MTRRRLLNLLLVSLLCLSSLNSATGQLTTADREFLLKQIETASNSLDPSRLPRYEQAAQVVIERVDQLKAFLHRGADAETRDAWLDYFNLEPLIGAIRSQATPGELANEAVSVRDRLIGTTPGLEMLAVRQVREAVDKLVDSMMFRDPEQSISMLRGQLETLSEMVQQVGATPSPDEFNAISARVALFESSGQTGELVRAFRDVFGRPNVAILVGSPLVQQAIERSVVRERPVRDCILGTRLVGHAVLSGNVTASLLPSSDAAQIQLTFVGNMVSDNIGYNGPVRLKTEGNAEVTVTRGMVVDSSGIQFGPALTEADLETRVLCIDHPLALVRNIASKQAAKQKPLADKIALEKLRSQVSSQFAAETGEVSPVTPSELLDRAETMLQRLSLTRPTQSWSSTTEAIQIDSVFRGPQQLASVIHRPEVSSPYAVAVQIHESAVENAFSVMLAGRSLNERRLNEILEKTAEMKRSEDEADSEPPFEISFSRSRPVIFECRDGRLRLGLRGTRFVQGDRVIRKAMEITAIYEPSHTDDGKVFLRRTDDVDVDFPRQRLTLGEAGLKPIIQKAFSKVFPEQVLDQPPRIGEDAKLQSLRGREFRTSSASAVDGWFSVVFQ